MIEKESGCVMHENAFVNTRQGLISLAFEAIGEKLFNSGNLFKKKLAG